MLEPDGAGPDRSWRLNPSASARLEELVSAATAHAARPAMAFGYHCDGCGRRAVTWLVGDEHRCADCGGQPDGTSDARPIQPVPLGAGTTLLPARTGGSTEAADQGGDRVSLRETGKGRDRDRGYVAGNAHDRGNPGAGTAEPRDIEGAGEEPGVRGTEEGDPVDGISALGTGRAAASA